MKRLVVLLCVAVAIPATAAYASLSGSGGGTTIANGQATLVSNTSNAYSYLTYNDLNGQPVSSLSELSADVVSAQYGGGAPRFSIDVTNGTDTKAIFVYLGDLPDYTTGSNGDTGNLLDGNVSGTRVDSTQIGGSYYGTWSDALAAATSSGYTTITGISLVVDGNWAQTSGSQTVIVDALSINGMVYTFSATSKADCKNGNWQLLGYKNQGDCISYVENSTK